MAQKKITDLDEIDALADADLIEVVDDVAGTPTSKKSTWTKIKSFLKSYFDEIYAGGLVLTTVNAANHTLAADEVAGAVNILHVTYTDTGTVAITIPTAVITSGEWTLFVKDADFNANTNNITIQTEGAETIDEGATYVMQYDGMSLSIYCDGSNLFIT